MPGILAQRLLPTVLVLAMMIGATSASSEEALFLAEQNAYNPIPSRDGSKVAFVQTGWGRPGGSGGFGRSNLRSDIGVADTDGKLLSDKPLADAFLAGWTSDGAALVCYRDWRFFLVALDGTKSQAGQVPDQESRPERVQYHPTTRRFLWLERDFGEGVVRTDAGDVLARHEHQLWPAYFAVSNDGKWLAAVSGEHLVVLNFATKQWTNLGPIVIHPDPAWDYVKPSWNPWFEDSSRLVFVSADRLVVATPDGEQKRTLCQLPAHAGLAVASPDGKQIAYATFSARPVGSRPDLTFWGDARVWVVSVEPSGDSQAITGENRDTIFTLRWLNEEAVMFDRLADRPFYSHARLWRAVVPHESREDSNGPPDDTAVGAAAE